ncbi:uncharacterized protein AMSG_11644 [Thecamonas trahens ATCC 50062]|uniref:Uncharacterized protein n=1 Tax=Thecamonas trahens ATCC 50062 TaxID=461836 RepID=A0A0L0DMJ9_THETB|nr:hypothetical protein AMSG_11644 [Thecamonas trahens ATCC 50062]KNC53544.1 hypothetical protein AMSG_11644 [Thecamonas trahens ATCC 50062]|eukprot:XP_013762043.1 hypothetical protein AMSG_11644 [Thecamonas trahens ATCC 50062]
MLADLPPELIHAIAHPYLDSRSVVALASTCSALHDALLGSPAAPPTVADIVAVFLSPAPCDDHWIALVHAIAGCGATLGVSEAAELADTRLLHPRTVLSIHALAALCGLEDVALELLETLPPSADGKAGLLTAAALAGLTRVTQRLLADGDVELAAARNNPVVLAAANNHCAMLKILLGEPGAHPGRGRSALCEAAYRGHLEATRLLLDHPLVDPSLDESLALTWAAKGGNIDVVNVLLADPRIDPGSSSSALSWAASRGDSDVVRALLAHPRTDPGAMANAALVTASINGHTTTVGILLAHPQVDATARNGEAMSRAYMAGHTRIVRLLHNAGAALPRGADPLPPLSFLERLPTEILHAIAFPYLDAPSIVALASSSWALHSALLGSYYARAHAAATMGVASCMERGMWRAAWIALARTSSSELPGLVSTPLLKRALSADLAAEEALDRHVLVKALARAGVVWLVSWPPKIGHVLWRDVFQPQVCLGAAAAVFGLEVLATELAQSASVQDQGQILRLGAAAGLLSLVELLLDDESLSSADATMALELASEHGHTDVAARLLADSRVDPAADNAIALFRAATSGAAGVIALLLGDPRVDPRAGDHRAVDEAVMHGHVEAALVLLADPRVDVTASQQNVFRMAAQCGLTEVFDYLLADARIDATADNNWALRLAAQAGQAGIVCKLLGLAGVDPAACNNEAIRFAADTGQDEVIALLLADPRVDPAAHDNWAIRRAARCPDAAAFRLLLADPRTDPTTADNFAIRWAARFGRLETVELLLADERVDPSALSHYALRWAVKYNHLAVVKLLTDDARVDVSNEHEALLYATGTGNDAMIAVLIAAGACLGPYSSYLN